MPGKAAKVLISEQQQTILQQLKNATTASKRLSQRAHLILLAFQGLRNEEIALLINLERHQVGIWRVRWADAFQRLTVIECTQPLAKLRDAIALVLDDDERSGAPPKFTPEQLVLIIALACEDPMQSGRPITHWTHRELADEACKRGIVPSISPSQVGRILTETDLQPHRYRYWLNPKEKDPETFARQARAVCATYEQALQRYEGEGTHTTCLDEKTGMQALERIAPDLRPQPGREARLEFEYDRHGTLCLTANFHVATGEVVSATMEPTRKEEELVGHMERTIATDAEASWITVCDNLNTHCSESLVRWVAKRLGIEEDLGVKGRRGILRSMSSRRAFLEDASHRIRFVYTPKHSSWLNQIELWFGILVRKLLRRLSVSSVEELRSRVLSFIKYFNKTMAKPFHWTYTGRPLQA